MKRRDFIRAAASPALIPLLDFFDEKVLLELKTKGIARLPDSPYGSQRYVANTWTVHGPMAVEAIGIIGPDYGREGEYKSTISTFDINREYKGQSTKLLEFAVISDNTFSWKPHPSSGALLFKADSSLRVIRDGKRDSRPIGWDGSKPVWNVFTTYRKGKP